jgi:hypothetical protein
VERRNGPGSSFRCFSPPLGREGWFCRCGIWSRH